MLKKILILTVLLVVSYFGYSSYQESQHKHQVFLLEQSLFPELTTELQKVNLKTQPLRAFLGPDSFKVIVSKPDGAANLEAARTTVFDLVTKWKSENQKYGHYQHSIHYPDEMTTTGWK